MAARVTWRQALAWRMRRQLLDPVVGVPPAEVVRRLCGVQAQVASSAELAVRVRQQESAPGEIAAALTDGRLIKTWAMRGTLHLLTPEDAGAVLSLLAAGRLWERPSWIRYFGVAPDVIPAGRRTAVSRQAGWIAPAVVMGGVVAGTWRLDGVRLQIAWFPEAGRPPRRALAAEVRRLSTIIDRELGLEISTS